MAHSHFDFKFETLTESENYLKKLEIKNATGLNNLPSKMVTMTAGIVEPSLASLSNQWPTECTSHSEVRVEEINLHS